MATYHEGSASSFDGSTISENDLATILRAEISRMDNENPQVAPNIPAVLPEETTQASVAYPTSTNILGPRPRALFHPYLPSSVPAPNPTLSTSPLRRRRPNRLNSLQPQSSIATASTAYSSGPGYTNFHGYSSAPPGYISAPAGYSSALPGYNGVPPGYNGVPPSYSGVPPGYNGVPPGYSGVPAYTSAPTHPNVPTSANFPPNSTISTPSRWVPPEFDRSSPSAFFGPTPLTPLRLRQISSNKAKIEKIAQVIKGYDRRINKMLQDALNPEQLVLPVDERRTWERGRVGLEMMMLGDELRKAVEEGEREDVLAGRHEDSPAEGGPAALGVPAVRVSAGEVSTA